MNSIDIPLPDEAATLALGQVLARQLPWPGVVYLEGQLGAGKTTLSRAVLRGLGHAGSVKSPTYTLVEPYEIDGRTLYHFDLYRLSDPEELEFLGIRDYFQQTSLCLIEWAEKGEGLLPPADLTVRLSLVDGGRTARLEAATENMQRVIDQVADQFAREQG